MTNKIKGKEKEMAEIAQKIEMIDLEIRILELQNRLYRLTMTNRSRWWFF